MVIRATYSVFQDCFKTCFGMPRSPAGEHQATPLNIVQLPTPVLQLVLSFVDSREKLTCIPLVCKSFRNALQGPSIAWTSVTLSSTDYLKLQRTNNLNRAKDWLVSHAGMVESFEISEEGCSHSTAQRLQPLRASAWSSSLAASRRTLRSLHLHVPIHPDLLPSIAQCSALTSLSFFVRSPPLTQHRTECLTVLSSLTQLTQLSILGISTYYEGSCDDACEADPSLRDTSSLTGDISYATEWWLPVDPLVGLTNLKKVHIGGELAVLPEDMYRLSSITCLTLAHDFNNYYLEGHPSIKNFSKMKNLQRLELSGCGFVQLEWLQGLRELREINLLGKSLLGLLDNKQLMSWEEEEEEEELYSGMQHMAKHALTPLPSLRSIRAVSGFLFNKTLAQLSLVPNGIEVAFPNVFRLHLIDFQGDERQGIRSALDNVGEVDLLAALAKFPTLEELVCEFNSEDGGKFGKWLETTTTLKRVVVKGLRPTVTSHWRPPLGVDLIIVDEDEDDDDRHRYHDNGFTDDE